MKKRFKKFADAILSNEQLKTIKGGYDPCGTCKGELGVMGCQFSTLTTQCSCPQNFIQEGCSAGFPF